MHSMYLWNNADICIDEVQTSRLFLRMKHKKQPSLAAESCSNAIIPFRTTDARAFRVLE